MATKIGTICHIEIPAPKMKKTKSFYTKLFGWDCTREMGPKYCMFMDGSMGGGFDATAKPTTRGTVLVIEVADIDKSLKDIKKAGGKVIKGKTEIGGGHGFFAYFNDPNGNRMGLHSS
jgi:predicted enzyme related to lactoylglutathione lyase